MNDSIINKYETLIASAIANPIDINIDAVDNFEEAHPDVVDASYQRGVKLNPTHTF